MSTRTPEPIAIDYATPKVLRPPRELLFRLGVWPAAIAGSVGVAILLLFIVTEVTNLVMIGFLWLGLGGLLTFVGFVCGATYAATAMARRFPAPATRRRALLAVGFPLVVLPTAAVCALVGLILAERLARTVYVSNVGPTPIDAIELLDSTGSQPLGRLDAGRYLRGTARDDDFVAIRVRRGDQVTEHVVDDYLLPMPGNAAKRVNVDGDGVVTLDGTDGSPILLPPTTGTIGPSVR